MRYTSLFILVLIGHLFFLLSCNEQAVKVPTVSSFEPKAGRIDTKITIYGTNFSERSADNDVRINGIPCTLLTSTPDSLVVFAGVGVTSGKISVTVGNLAGVSFDDYIVKPQTITSMSPSEGSVGDEITITGSNYGNAVEDVKLFFYDSIRADIYDYQSIGEKDTIKSFKTKVPQSAVTGKISVWIDQVEARSETDFTVLP